MKRAKTGFAAAAVFAGLLLGPAAAQTGAVEFTPDEISRILSPGPWPPPWQPDPGNRLSGNADAIALGETLFFERRLSGTRTISCAGCHIPEFGWSDAHQTAIGIAPVDRNTPGLLDARLNRWFGWDGASDSLWHSGVRPLLDRREMASSPAHVASVLREDAALACLALRTLDLEADDETVMVGAAKAMAAFMETLESGRTPFDRFRDALAEGRDDPDYPPAARRGLRTFVGEGNCHICHFGPAFTNGEFDDVGIPHFIAPGRVDPGRHGGIRALLASPFNLLGRYNDDPSGGNALGPRHVELQHRNWGEFRVPTLRSLEATAPYMHNGIFFTLSDVVRHYSEVSEDRLHSDGARLVRPLRLSPGEIGDLVAVLRTLSAPDAAKPHAAGVSGDCDRG